LVQVQVQVPEVKFKFQNFLELELFLELYQSLIITSIFVIPCWFGIKSAKSAINWPDIPMQASKWN
jgi:hypothetical protein